MCHLTIDASYKMLISYMKFITVYIIILQQNTMPRRARFQHQKLIKKEREKLMLSVDQNQAAIHVYLAPQPQAFNCRVICGVAKIPFISFIIVSVE